METTNTELTPEQEAIAAKMDQATQDLSSYIQFLCDKYGAEFIVQKVIFSFVPKMSEQNPDMIEAVVKEI